ncbi:hypothetical protein HAX54_012770 [Datura stramonium]|uniref:Uncharacterized protein n=1 Tax=Datura stramonium TaxID=4076 RepID=A0ABS8TN55_DATST|nr:hypothetical protein [Datura stramonium]
MEWKKSNETCEGKLLLDPTIPDIPTGFEQLEYEQCIAMPLALHGELPSASKFTCGNLSLPNDRAPDHDIINCHIPVKCFVEQLGVTIDWPQAAQAHNNMMARDMLQIDSD